MAKYRKNSVVIEAFQYDGDLKGRDGNWYVPDWAVEAYEKGVMHYGSESCDVPPCELFIETLEGIHHVLVGDYVIQGVSGELYPCKPDIFEKTYEAFGDLLAERIISEKEIELINDLIVQAIKHGGDGGGTYFSNENGLISAINAWLKFKGIMNKYQQGLICGRSIKANFN